MSELSSTDKRILINGYKIVYSASNPKNPTGKNYSDFTSDDLKKVETGALIAIRRFIRREYFDVIDEIVPNGMSRAEFSRAVLREVARRGDIATDYIDMFPDVKDYSTRKVTVQRQAVGLKDNLPASVTELAAVIAIRDAGVDMTVSGNPYFRLQPDVAKILSKDPNKVVPISEDTSAYDFGYTTGAMKRFNQGDALHIRLESPLPPNELQARYCPVVEKIFEEGKELSSRDAFALGFMQGRIDGRTNFESTNDRIGLFADCPSTAKRASGKSR